MSSDDDRFVVPLYSAVEAARHLDVPASTFRAWARGYRNQPRGRRPVVGEPIVTTLPPRAALRRISTRRWDLDGRSGSPAQWPPSKSFAVRIGESGPGRNI
ncbi:MAG: hypothetical protein ACRDTD_07345 [Pseudonocardiaceae bacterium]